MKIAQRQDTFRVHYTDSMTSHTMVLNSFFINTISNGYTFRHLEAQLDCRGYYGYGILLWIELQEAVL